MFIVVISVHRIKKKSPVSQEETTGLHVLGAPVYHSADRK